MATMISPLAHAGRMQIDLKKLPNLPGYTFPEYKEHHHKAPGFDFIGGQRVEMKEGLTHDRPKMVRAVKIPQTARVGTTFPQSTMKECHSAREAKDYDHLPAWDALDRHVLRFYGFFKEAVVESNFENHRVRKCVIFYYLEDDTMHISEPKEDNSGIAQGTLVRRHRFPGPGGTYIQPKDIKVGQELTVYGKVIKVCDCDAFSRNYYDSIGSAQPGPVDHHPDPYKELRDDARVRVAAQARTYEKLYREVQLGGGHINENMQQFMENDRQVCRFFAVLDDVATEQYERRPFTILYFLSNDTVEIRERYPLNCGRDNFPIFLKRTKLARGKTEARGPQDGPQKEADCVQVTDFSIGGDIDLIHHSFQIYDADDFTRAYFKSQLGIELGEKVDVSIQQRSVPKPPTPPYTGYGSWDDSMSSVLHLIPKVPRKDFHKLYNNDGKVLRFTAKFANPKSEDADRFFVINFHLFDDTMSIHEPPQRNTGIVTGRFLEKGVHLNQATGNLFTPEDFMPGNVVKVFNHELLIMDMDKYTRKYLTTGNPTTVNLQAVLEKLRESMRQQFPLVRDIFRRFDTDHNGVITLQEFKQALRKYGFQMTESEVHIIMRHFDTLKDGQVTYNEFCDALLDEDYTTQMLKTKPGLDQSVDSSYSARAEQKGQERAETEKIRKATKEIGDVMYKHTGAMQKLFKEFTHLTHQPYVTCEQVHSALAKIGYVFPLEDIQRCILFIVPEADLDCIDYVHFVKSLVACYHDLSASR